MDLPIILIKSDGQYDPNNIIQNIRKSSLETDLEVIDQVKNIIGYRHHIITKYYETDILLCPVNSLTDLSEHILSLTEGIIIYFEVKNRDFLEDLPKYAEFSKSNQIELGILLCDRLAEETKDGITYSEAKQFGKQLDVIELNRELDQDEEYDIVNNPMGYDELHLALNSCLWSNISIHKSSEMNFMSALMNNHSEYNDSDDESNVNEEHAKLPEEIHEPDSEFSEKELEEEMVGFENLLTQVLSFRPHTKTWTRNERLLYAEKFATVFDNLIDDEDDIDDSESSEGPAANGNEETHSIKSDLK